MKIKKAMRLLYLGEMLYRRDWHKGLYCVSVRSEVVFYNEQNKLVEELYLDVNDLIADDWEML